MKQESGKKPATPPKAIETSPVSFPATDIQSVALDFSKLLLEKVHFPTITSDSETVLSTHFYLETFAKHKKWFTENETTNADFKKTLDRVKEYLGTVNLGDPNYNFTNFRAEQSSRTIKGGALAPGWPFHNTLRWIDDEFLLAEIDLDEKTANIVNDGPSVTSAESDRIKKIITGIYYRETNLLSVDPHDFERIIAELLRYQGYRVDLTKRTRDGGFDLIALSQAKGDFPLKFLVECKRYTSEKIGIEIVRQLMYVVQQEQANKGIIATTSYFSQEVKKHQTSVVPYLLDLRDKDDILQWIRNYGAERLLLATEE
jgi:hypothetical protein